MSFQRLTKQFFGRHREMDELCYQLEEAAEGRGSVVLIAGEPGAGSRVPGTGRGM